MEKIAIPTNNGKVSAHFGHCPQFTIYNTKGSEVESKEIIENPGHKPGFLPRFLADKNIDLVLAGGMGTRAINLFNDAGVEVVTGVKGDVDNCINEYLAGNLDTDDNACDH
ncbi:MAG TPA: NifB/NifX family molybdenum-iron cluster-binding protein [Halanaerobiales bacterium]|nr:NifB/NifX family molybdenum-iron cluster-binding protein [Halanaerobiales bacterium]